MKTKDDLEFLTEQAKIFGFATASLSDGTAFIFNKAHLQKLIDKNPDQNYINILIEKKSNGN